jgi:hypothetical protein
MLYALCSLSQTLSVAEGLYAMTRFERFLPTSPKGSLEFLACSFYNNPEIGNKEERLDLEGVNHDPD